MRIVQIEIRNFRGIRKLDWNPLPGMNCLIGPGDSTKTTILDAIDLALNPRTNYLADDTHFYNLDLTTSATVTVTLVDMPPDFYSDRRYGLHLRGWNDELRGKVGDGVNQAADLISATASIPSLNFIPLTTFGNWF